MINSQEGLTIVSSSVAPYIVNYLKKAAWFKWLQDGQDNRASAIVTIIVAIGVILGTQTTDQQQTALVQKILDSGMFLVLGVLASTGIYHRIIKKRNAILNKIFNGSLLTDGEDSKNSETPTVDAP